MSPAIEYEATRGRRARYTRSTAVSAGPHAICVLAICGPIVSFEPLRTYGALYWLQPAFPLAVPPLNCTPAVVPATGTPNPAPAVSTQFVDSSGNAVAPPPVVWLPHATPKS